MERESGIPNLQLVVVKTLLVLSMMMSSSDENGRMRSVEGQLQIPPPKYDGFVYEIEGGDKGGLMEDSIMIEAYFDPVCPDSRDSWPPLKQALHFHNSRRRSSISLIVHPFPLPYHDNSFVACRALHIANRLNSSTTYHLLEFFFKYQEKYYNKPTSRLSRASIVDHIVKLSAKAIGNNSLTDIQSGFKDVQTDHAARISFKYGCSRGVKGTPSFFVNGFPLPDEGSALDYKKWRSIIDPLLSTHKQ